MANVVVALQIALTHVKLSDGNWLLHAKKATGFTNSEEEAVEKTKVGMLLYVRLQVPLVPPLVWLLTYCCSWLHCTA